MNNQELFAALRQENGKRPATLLLSDRARACLAHLTANADPEHDYVPYVGVTLGEKKPHFVHHRLDWTEVLPYSIYGAVVARNLCGVKEPSYVEQRQRKLLLANISPKDGLIYAPSSPWSKGYPLCLWEQSRLLHALEYWYMDEPQDWLLDKMKQTVSSLFALSTQSGRSRVFSTKLLAQLNMGPVAVGEMIDPVLKVYELTGEPKAYQLGVGMTYWMLDERAGFFDHDGNMVGPQQYRSAISCFSGFVRAALLCGDQALLQRAKQLHDKMTSYVTTYGATPCREPACSDMELILSAVLLAQNGYPEYFDQIDCYVRNQTCEAQFLDKSRWREGLAHDGLLPLPDFQWIYDGQLLKGGMPVYDDFSPDVLNKSVGGFLWSDATEQRFAPSTLMLCCAAHAMRSFQIVQDACVRDMPFDLRVELHFNAQTPLAELVSFEPYEGKFAVIPKKDCRQLLIRLPAHVSSKEVSVLLDGETAPFTFENGYLALNNVKKGSVCLLLWEMVSRETSEKVFYLMDDAITEQFTVKALWRGNTVLSLTPQRDNPKRLYQRQTSLPEQAPLIDAPRVQPLKCFNW